jgi:uncharacterized RDD family membrane protein YckC
MSEMIRSDLVVANPLLRGGAFLIDAAIMGVVNVGFGVIYYEAGLSEQAIIALFLSATAAYHIGFVATRSATLGKTLMGIYIGDADGRPVQPDTAILRYVVLAVPTALGIVSVPLSFVGFCLTLASIVMVLTDKRRRAVHDRVAGTVVLVGRPGAALGN